MPPCSPPWWSWTRTPWNWSSKLNACFYNMPWSWCFSHGVGGRQRPGKEKEKCVCLHVQWNFEFRLVISVFYTSNFHLFIMPSLAHFSHFLCAKRLTHLSSIDFPVCLMKGNLPWKTSQSWCLLCCSLALKLPTPAPVAMALHRPNCCLFSSMPAIRLPTHPCWGQKGDGMRRNDRVELFNNHRDYSQPHAPLHFLEK